MMQEAAQQDSRGTNARDVVRAAQLTLERDTWPISVAVARETDRYLVRVDSLVACKPFQIAQRISSPAADVQHHVVRARFHSIVERRHVDAADRHRPDVVVDERGSQNSLI